MSYPVSKAEAVRCINLLWQKYIKPFQDKWDEMELIREQLRTHRRDHDLAPDYGELEPVEGDPKHKYYFAWRARWYQLDKECGPFVAPLREVKVVMKQYRRGDLALAWWNLVDRFICSRYDPRFIDNPRLILNGYTEEVVGGCIGFYGFESGQSRYVGTEIPQDLRPRPVDPSTLTHCWVEVECPKTYQPIPSPHVRPLTPME